MDAIPVEAFLADFPVAIRDAAGRLRDLVTQAVPNTVERVRPGWRLIGYDLPVSGRTRYFAYVAPEVRHIHLGFEYGAWMADPARMLEGAHLKLRKVRFLTFQPGQTIQSRPVIELIREGARVATMSQAERMAVVLDRPF